MAMGREDLLQNADQLNITGWWILDGIGRVYFQHVINVESFQLYSLRR